MVRIGALRWGRNTVNARRVRLLSELARHLVELVQPLDHEALVLLGILRLAGVAFNAPGVLV
jgi:hypothetical protein